MIEVTAYKANDGKLFGTKKMALNHERALAWAPRIAEFLKDRMYPYNKGSLTYVSITYRCLERWEQFKAGQRPRLEFQLPAPKSSAGNVQLKKRVAARVRPYVAQFEDSQLFEWAGQGYRTMGLALVTAWEQFKAGAYLELEPPLEFSPVSANVSRTPLTKLGLSPRALSRLALNDILTLGELLSCQPKSAQGMSGMGPVSWKEVHDALKQRGLRLGQLSVPLTQ